MSTGSPPVDYVLPLRWAHDDPAELADLTRYLRWLAGRTRVIVVDGSPEPLFTRHHLEWSNTVTHVPPRVDGFLNGKVSGVHTGVLLATCERVVVADDDVRYDDASLTRTVALLEDADLVGPQNVFDPMPWHALWDTSRSLLNRSVAADYPGTFALRRATFLAMGGYDGNVLFENLELMRTVRAFGGRVDRPLDIYVSRRPPAASKFLGQRVRQAYDDFAQPWRLLTYLPVLPLALGSPRGRRLVAGGLLASIALAEVGRRRQGGTAVFPAKASLLAPAWVLERSACSWLAVGQRLRGGVRYAGERLAVAAHRPATLRRTPSRPLVAPGGPEARSRMGPVAERLEGRTPAPAQRDGTPTRVDLPAFGVDDAELTAQQ